MNTNTNLNTHAMALEIVTHVLQDMSSELDYPALKAAQPDTELFGGANGIDSLSLVRIVAEVEREAEQKVGKRVVLADERAMSRRNSPFRNVTTLADLLAERIEEQS